MTELLKAFLVGGLLCVIGQLLIDKTKLMSGRILVLYVCIGCILGGLGIYQKIEGFGGAGATVPLTGLCAATSMAIWSLVPKCPPHAVVTSSGMSTLFRTSQTSIST